MSVLTHGMLTSPALVKGRQDKVNEGLAKVQAQIARLTQAGVQPSAGFLAQFQALQQQLAVAMQQPSNEAQRAALKPVKDAARTIAKQSAQRVDVILADVAIMRQQ
ncbi:MAG TPA: hypothetical protein VIZ17_11465, partial [Acetobacteraceae bacterium]